MFDWFAKLDPNYVIPGVVFFATWLYHKIKGDSTATLEDNVWDAILAEVHRIVVDPDSIANARQLLADAAWRLLGKLNIPRNAWSEAVVYPAIERGLTELQKLVLPYTLHKAIADVADRAGNVLAEFTPPAHPTIPPLELDIQVVKDVPPPETGAPGGGA